MPLRIEDYALIGDCETAALVGRDGSIDWLCVPRFDSAACFAALLGTPEHGRWLLAPAAPVLAVRRRYRPDTLVLETEYETAAGVVVLTDCMPVRADTPHLIRLVEGRRGAVAMRLELVIRLDYGSLIPWVAGQLPPGVHPRGADQHRPQPGAWRGAGRATPRGVGINLGAVASDIVPP